MAIYDQSYRPWTGAYSSRLGRVGAMVRLEITQPFKNVWVLIVILGAFALVMAWLLLLFIGAAGAGEYGPAGGDGFEKFLQRMLATNRLYRDGFYNFPASAGGNSLSLFMLILMFLSATVGSSLIARDLKYNALLMYFSRSITRVDYLAGKFLTLALVLLFVTLLPGLLLFVGTLGMGVEKLNAGQRLMDLLGIVLHSLVIVVPMSAAVLAFSSLTKRPYVAAILWATLFFSSWIFSGVLGDLLHEDWCRMVSWMNLTVHLGNYCYPDRSHATPVLECGWGPPLLILGLVTAGSLAVAWYRIRTVESHE